MCHSKSNSLRGVSQSRNGILSTRDWRSYGTLDSKGSLINLDANSKNETLSKSFHILLQHLGFKLSYDLIYTRWTPNKLMENEVIKNTFTWSASSLMTSCTQSSTGTSPDFRLSSGLGGGSYFESIPVKPEIETRQACQLRWKKAIKSKRKLSYQEEKEEIYTEPQG